MDIKKCKNLGFFFFFPDFNDEQNLPCIVTIMWLSNSNLGK